MDVIFAGLGGNMTIFFEVLEYVQELRCIPFVS